MSDILNARAVEPALPALLTAHLRAQLLAQYRQDLRADEMELAYLTREAAEDKLPNKRRTHRIGALHLRATATREAIAEMDGRA